MELVAGRHSVHNTRVSGNACFRFKPYKVKVVRLVLTECLAANSDKVAPAFSSTPCMITDARCKLSHLKQRSCRDHQVRHMTGLSAELVLMVEKLSCELRFRLFGIHWLTHLQRDSSTSEQGKLWHEGNENLTTLSQKLTETILTIGKRHLAKRKAICAGLERICSDRVVTETSWRKYTDVQSASPFDVAGKHSLYEAACIQFEAAVCVELVV